MGCVLRRSIRSLLNLVLLVACLLFFLTGLQITLLSPCQIDIGPEGRRDFIPTGKKYYNSPLKEQPMKPFEDGEPHYILVLSYQRSGSSFFGQLLNENRNIHFLYEPLDSVYSGLYGTPEGWNVPTDIASYWNGSERELPDFEAEAVGSTLYDLYTCNHSNLATETLIHRFWKQFSTYQLASVRFGTCVAGTRVSLGKCRGELRAGVCGERLGDPAQMQACRDLISRARFRWDGKNQNIELQEKTEAALRNQRADSKPKPGSDRKDLRVVQRSLQAVDNMGQEKEKFKKIHYDREKDGVVKFQGNANQGKPVRSRFKRTDLGGLYMNKNSQDSDLLRFMKYHKCLADSRQKISKCEQVFSVQCKATPVRAIKTVRATMETAKYLLEKLPNLRVIHLIRDPRAVVVSRSEFDGSGSGVYAGRPVDLVREAGMFCRQMVRDIKLRHQLQQLYPGQIMEIIYDDFVLQPKQYTELVYKFANVTLPKKLMKWVDKQTAGYANKRKNSTYIATKWQEKMSYRVSKEVTAECEEFFKYATYEWPE